MEKFIVIVFPNGLQGQLWSTILRSQNLSVIWESPDVPLPGILKDLHRKRLLPDLLIVDTRLHHLQPLHLCRWCRRHGIDLKILLVNGIQPRILTGEKQWALAQGAVDLLPRITQHSLLSGSTKNLHQVLDVLEVSSCDQPALVRALLSMGLSMPFQYDHQSTNSDLEAPSYRYG